MLENKKKMEFCGESKMRPNDVASGATGKKNTSWVDVVKGK